MDVRIGSKTNPLISLNSAVVQIKAQLDQQPNQWLEELSKNPTQFAQLEQQVHQTFSKLADQLVAGLIAQASKKSAVQAAKKKSRRQRKKRCARLKNVR